MRFKSSACLVWAAAALSSAVSATEAPAAARYLWQAASPSSSDWSVEVLNGGSLSASCELELLLTAPVGSAATVSVTLAAGSMLWAPVSLPAGSWAVAVSLGRVAAADGGLRMLSADGSVLASLDTVPTVCLTALPAPTIGLADGDYEGLLRVPVAKPAAAPTGSYLFYTVTGPSGATSKPRLVPDDGIVLVSGCCPCICCRSLVPIRVTLPGDRP